MNSILSYRLFLLATLTLYLTSCQTENVQPMRAMYVWESNRTKITESEQQFLRDNEIHKLYIKFFEVEKNADLGIHPTAKSDITFPVKGINTEIVPTVYIRNDVFKKVSKRDLDELAENMIFLIEKSYKRASGNSARVFKEIQIDCDWTISTKDNYFYFLRRLKEQTSKSVSATLRLYPYKFPDKMGILPVDRAMLMCYNLLSPLESGQRNSILDLEELEKYLQGADKYPIPLDLALPTYSNALLYQHDQFVGLHHMEGLNLKNILSKKKNNIYHVTKDTLLDQTFLREGDQVKLEIVDAKLVQSALKIIGKNVCFEPGASLSLFHLTSSQLNTFSDAEVSSIYSPLSY